MTSKPLIILGSVRKESDTKEFVDSLFSEISHTVIDLLDVKIYDYDYGHHYPADDRYDNVIEELLNHQQIIFATPVYWYSMSALMKTFFDRFSDLVTYKKAIGRKFKGKATALVAVGAEQKLPEGFEIPFSCTSTYLDMGYRGSIYHCTKEDEIDEQKAVGFLKKLGIEK